MVLANLLFELVCNGFLYLFVSPFMPEKKDKVELDNYNFDFPNPEDDSKLSEKETDLQWWDGEISKTETVGNFNKRCKYYFDVEDNGKKRKKRCKNYHCLLYTSPTPRDRG